MTTEQTALQRLKEVCEAENGRDPDILCYSPEYLEVASTALPSLIELCEALELEIQCLSLLAPLDKLQQAAANVESARARLDKVCQK